MPISHLARRLFLSVSVVMALPAAQGQVERVWLSHQSSDPGHVVVNWETTVPTPSIVRYGLSPAYGTEVKGEGLTTRHHVEIAVPKKGTVYHYSVGEAGLASADATFKSQPLDELRVAIVGDWGFARGKNLTALLRDDVHLLLTAGDNVPSLHETGLEGAKAYSALIHQQPALFRSVPFMPILGNHDREVRPRGTKPPAAPVYDIEARTFREFFALPGEEWHWSFDIPDFDLRFFALDLNHISDFGTTWQTCHAWQVTSDQFRWYQKSIDQTAAGFVFTLNNERQSSVAGATKGAWHTHFRKGSALVTGFGYFAERAELEGGLPYFNTCLKGDGSPYKDSRSAFFASQDNYLLLTFRRGEEKMKVEIKNLKGEVLDIREIAKRAGR